MSPVGNGSASQTATGGNGGMQGGPPSAGIGGACGPANGGSEEIPAADDGLTPSGPHLALGHTAAEVTYEIGGKTVKRIDLRRLDNFAREQGAVTYRNKPFSDIDPTMEPDKFAKKLIDCVVRLNGRISFNLQGVDVESVLAGGGRGAYTPAELRYIAGNPAARAITTFFNVTVPF